jgi:uncharacterized protein
MVTEEIMRKVIKDQAETIKAKKSVKRNMVLPEAGKQIIIISGVRRCGKSTLLHKLFGANSNAIFVNFEDPRLDDFELSDFNKIEKIASEDGRTIFIYDEIQNIAEWERYARSAIDRGLKIYITGSNAAMLSRELGTRLTGRYRQYELFPFDFKEFLVFNGYVAGEEKFNQYLTEGGFPEFLENKDRNYLRSLLKDIIIRDIAVRRKIKNEHLLIRLAIYLLSNTGKEFSYNKITQMLNIRSVRSTIDYCDYLRESYLVELIPAFSFSARHQLGGFKKAYGIDTGLVRANSLSLTEDNGRLLENAVFLHLRRENPDILYFRGEKTECDFLTRENQAITRAVQVCWHINEDNIKREVTGIKQAMQATGAASGLILTHDQEDELDGITVMPVWKWMVGK